MPDRERQGEEEPNWPDWVWITLALVAGMLLTFVLLDRWQGPRVPALFAEPPSIFFLLPGFS